jgi:hypothetical protein
VLIHVLTYALISMHTSANEIRLKIDNFELINDSPMLDFIFYLHRVLIVVQFDMMVRF